jgi:hypothetical protein
MAKAAVAPQLTDRRCSKAGVLSGPFDFSKAENRAKLVDLMAPLNTTTKTSDGKTYVAFLAMLPPAN